MSRVFLNGRLVARSEARLDLDDAGFLAGDGIFETLRADEGVPALLDEHLDRLFASLPVLRLEIPWPRASLREQVLQLAASETPRGPAKLRVTVTRGSAGDPDAPGGPSAPTCLVTARAYVPPPPDVYARGVEVEVSRHLRHPHPLQQLKCTSWQWSLFQRREASGARVFDVIQFNDAGCLAEGSFTNVFVVDVDGVVRTPAPAEGCLPGVTRAAVLEIARRTLPVREGDVDRATLAGAREIFLTSSLVEVVPVRAVDARPAGAEIPGPVTRALAAAYAARVRPGREPDGADRGAAASGRRNP